MASKIKGYEKSLYRDHTEDYTVGEDMEDRNLPLYALQTKVERLPVPKLQDTLALYLKSVKPHVTAEEFDKTKKYVEEFGKKGGIGEVLQERLLKRAAERPNTSWLQEWWNDIAYLSYRDPVVYNVSYYLQFKNEAPCAMSSPTRRAARFVFHALEFRNLVITGQLEPDMRKGGIPMSNSQWRYMFNACRMPASKKDFVRTYAPDLYTHIVVARKNHFFVFDVFKKDSFTRLSADAIEHQLNQIVRIADTMVRTVIQVNHNVTQGENPDPVGVLTTENRDVWTKARPMLLEGEGKNINQESLEKIQSSIFVVCLVGALFRSKMYNTKAQDDTSPITREEIGRNLLHSDGKNRFFDKSWQFGTHLSNLSILNCKLHSIF